MARPARTLVFVRTKHGADRLARQLSRAGTEAGAIHGNLAQNARQRALDAFAAGRTRVLVATDVAARGIHVDDVDLVVHYDPPADHKDYLHRSGRTARAGASGIVLSLLLPDQVRRRDGDARPRRRGHRPDPGRRRTTRRSSRSAGPAPRSRSARSSRCRIGQPDTPAHAAERGRPSNDPSAAPPRTDRTPPAVDSGELAPHRQPTVSSGSAGARVNTLLS